MPITAPTPTSLPPTSTPGPYEIQDSTGATLYAFNVTAHFANASAFMTSNVKLESAGGSSVQWDTGDGQFAGGALMIQERKQWDNAQGEADDLNLIRQALKTAVTYLANVESGTRCLLLPGSWRDVIPVRSDRKYGLSEVNVMLKPANKDDAALVIAEGSS